jgi:hypothetical protein
VCWVSGLCCYAGDCSQSHIKPTFLNLLITGWTGLFCDKRYETCDNQAGHTCYHGGECIPGLQDKYSNEQLFCDCSYARGENGTKYVGKYCETPFEQICNPGAPEDELVFCVNGGECNPSFP